MQSAAVANAGEQRRQTNVMCCIAFKCMSVASFYLFTYFYYCDHSAVYHETLGNFRERGLS